MVFFVDSERCHNCNNIFVFTSLATFSDEKLNIVAPINAIECPYCNTRHKFNKDTQAWELCTQEISNEQTTT